MPPADPSLDSPYAPPRAGRGAGIWRAWFAFRRRSRIREAFRGPASRAAASATRSVAVSSSTLGAIAVPTLGFYLLPNPLWRRIGPAVFWLALFFALTEYGRSLGSAAFGLAAGAQGIAAAACSDLRAPSLPFRVRVLRRVLIALVAALFLALVASRLVSPHLVAINGQNGPVLIKPSSAAPPARVGELLAYRLPERGHGGVYIRGGIYWGRVLAVPPSRSVVFDQNGYHVDDTARATLPRMPAQGRLEIAADQAFIWPEVFHFQQGAAASLPAEVGLVPHSALVGRPYKRWFWHTQSP